MGDAARQPRRCIENRCVVPGFRDGWIGPRIFWAGARDGIGTRVEEVGTLIRDGGVFYLRRDLVADLNSSFIEPR